MGEVWRAYDTRRRRTVALKRLAAAQSDRPEFRARFRRESELAARLAAPNIIPIHDFGEIDGRLFLDMRLVAGRDLATTLAAGGPSRRRGPHRCSPSWERRWTRRTRPDSCTATSSRPTPCSSRRAPVAPEPVDVSAAGSRVAVLGATGTLTLLG